MRRQGQASALAPQKAHRARKSQPDKICERPEGKPLGLLTDRRRHFAGKLNLRSDHDNAVLERMLQEK